MTAIHTTILALLIGCGRLRVCDQDGDCDGARPEDEQDDNGNGIPNCADP
jgi:hypothetical protein